MAINVRYWALATLLAPALAFAFAAFPEQLTEDSRAVRDTAQSFGRAADGVFSQEFGERERLRGDIESGAAKRQDAFNVSNEDRALYQKQQEGLGISEEKRRERIKAQLRGFVAQLAQELQEKNYPIPPSELSRQQRVVEESVSVKGRTVCLDFRGLNVRGDKPCVTLEENEVELNAARHAAFFQRLAALLYEENNQVLAALQANGDFVASASESVSSSESSRALAGGSSFGSNSPVGWAKDVDVDRIETQLSQGGKFESEARVENAGGATIKGKDTPVENFVNELPSYNGSYSPPSGAVPSAPSNNFRPSGGESLQRAPALARSAPNLPVAPIRNTQSAAPAHQNKAITSAPKDDPASRAPTRNLADSGTTPKDSGSQADLLCTYLGGKYCGGGADGAANAGGDKPGSTYVNKNSLDNYFRSNDEVRKAFKTPEAYRKSIEDNVCKMAAEKGMSEQEICKAANYMLPECGCEKQLKSQFPDQKSLRIAMRKRYAEHTKGLKNGMSECLQKISEQVAVAKGDVLRGDDSKSGHAPKASCAAVAHTAVLSNLMSGKFAACRLLGQTQSSCDFTKAAPTCVQMDSRDLSGLGSGSQNRPDPIHTIRQDALDMWVSESSGETASSPATPSVEEEKPDILREYLREATSQQNVDPSAQLYDGWPDVLQTMIDRQNTNGSEKYSLRHLLFNLSVCEKSDQWLRFLDARRQDISTKLKNCIEEPQQSLPPALKRAVLGSEAELKAGKCPSFSKSVTDFYKKLSESDKSALKIESSREQRDSVINLKDGELSCMRLWREANLIDSVRPFGQFYRGRYPADDSAVEVHRK